MTNQKKKIFAYAAIAAALTLSPLTGFGQASPATSTDTATTSQTTNTDDRGARAHHDYGWLGLLGLLGLTGLMRKRDNDHRVDYNERSDDRRSTTGSRS
jgi:MYXO-CTERM domain-containing protein